MRSWKAGYDVMYDWIVCSVRAGSSSSGILMNSFIALTVQQWRTSRPPAVTRRQLRVQLTHSTSCNTQVRQLQQLLEGAPAAGRTTAGIGCSTPSRCTALVPSVLSSCTHSIQQGWPSVLRAILLGCLALLHKQQVGPAHSHGLLHGLLTAWIGCLVSAAAA